MSYKVSIIIPAYNVEKYIFRAIESSINQSYKNIEIIIVDDGSTDKTWDVISIYKEKDKRIVAIRQKNCGVSSARNKGLNISSGDYCIFIDSDDWISENCVEEMINYLNKFKRNILISSDCYYASFNNNIIEIKSSKKNYKDEETYMNKNQSIISFCETKYRLSSACYKLYNLKLIKKIGLKFDVNISHGEDGLFVYNYLNNCNGMYYFNKPLWYILDRPGSATTSKYNKKWLSAIVSAEIIYKSNTDKKINNYFKLYCCSRITTVLCSAIITDKRSKDIVFMRKKMREYIGGILVEKKIKKIVLYIIIAYFPTYVSYLFLRIFDKK